MNKLLSSVDHFFDRIYGARWNPLYNSGAVAIFLMSVCLVTGVALLIFFRVDAPYESVKALQNYPILLDSLRSIHRYASDLSLAVVLFHIFRMYAEGKYWGQRTLAWASGSILLLLLLIIGWTGLVIVWDQAGYALARAGAQMLGLERTVSGAAPPGPSFFFFNLFLHMSLPLVMIFVLWIHTSKMKKPVWLVPKRHAWKGFALLVFVSLLFPAPLGPPAHALMVDQNYDLSLLYGFPLLLVNSLGPLPAFLIIACCFLLIALTPWIVPHRRPYHKNPLSQPRSLAKKAFALVTGFIVLSGAVSLSQIPIYKSVNHAILRISLRIPGQGAKECRELSAQEVQKKPLHMRTSHECRSVPLQLRLKVQIDEKVLYAGDLTASGSRHDRPLTSEQEFAVPAGSHKVKVSLTPHSESDFKNLELLVTETFRNGRVGLVSYDMNEKILSYTGNN